MERTELILCQYSATGVFFYSIYEKKGELAKVSALVLPKVSEVRICTKFGNYVSVHDMEATLFPGLKRLVMDENENTVAELIWNDFDKFTLRTGEGTVCITLCTNGFEGCMESQKIFEAKLLERKYFGEKSYIKMGYDITRMYKVVFEGNVSEQMKVWIGAFLMLKFV